MHLPHFLAVNTTVYFPATYVLMGSISIEVVLSPKSQTYSAFSEVLRKVTVPVVG
jgi:hypothetical protein